MLSENGIIKFEFLNFSLKRISHIIKMTNNKILFISNESRKRQYNTKSLPQLKIIGKKAGLLM